MNLDKALVVFNLNYNDLEKYNESDIKKIYFRLVKENHPDNNANGRLEIEEIKEAFSILKEYKKVCSEFESNKAYKNKKEVTLEYEQFERVMSGDNLTIDNMEVSVKDIHDTVYIVRVNIEIELFDGNIIEKGIFIIFDFEFKQKSVVLDFDEIDKDSIISIKINDKEVLKGSPISNVIQFTQETKRIGNLPMSNTKVMIKGFETKYVMNFSRS